MSAYAKAQSDSADIIANSYLDIIRDYRKIYKDDDLMFYQTVSRIIFFDHIQTLFNQRWFQNASALMNTIYDRLLPVLSDSFQFYIKRQRGNLKLLEFKLDIGI